PPAGLRIDPKPAARATSDRFIRPLLALRPNTSRVSPVQRGSELPRFESGGQSRIRVRRARRPRRRRIGTRSAQAEDRRRFRWSTPAIGPTGSLGDATSGSRQRRGPRRRGGRVSRYLWQIDGEYDRRSGGGPDETGQNVRGQRGPATEEGERHQRRLRPIFDRQEADEGQNGEGQRDRGLDREEPVRRGNRKRVHEQD